MHRTLQWNSSRAGILLVAAVVATAGAADDIEGRPPITLSEHPQLFLDDYLIAEKSNIRQVLNPPVKHLENPLDFEPEYPWELARMDPGCVIYDPDKQRFRMWYTVLMDKARYADNYGYVCYAESEDGIHWRKPMLEIHDFEGQRPTNIVFKGPMRAGGECLFPSIIYMPEDVEQPYKMLFTHRRSPDNPSHYGLHTATSKDGLN